ncbi:hypothetical protein ACQ4LE_008842 [Meloidogyne hapla]
MGNSASEHHHQGRFFRPENLSNDPTAFRVFIKKKNKFIPGWLKVNDDEILFMRGSSHFQCWSLAHLRRYGYTCSGVFFFESGRRCATGEGLHTFQSHQAERIFHMVQSKIKIEEYARYSRLGSVANSTNTNNTPVRVNSLVPAPLASQRIHPVQRFSSEGAPSPCNVPTATVPTAPPPYSALYQEARRAQQNASPSCPSIISAVSTTVAGANCCTNRVERPRSVVSNIEHGTAIHPHRTLHQHAINGNTSSSTLNQHILQQQHGYITPSIPPQMHHSLAISASGSCLMDASYHSALDANGVTNGSPWASQQQLERGEIVMEHVLGNNEDSVSTGGRRRFLAPGKHISSNHQQHGTLPIRVPVPPPMQSTSDCNNQSLTHCAACSSSTLSNSSCPPPPPPRDQKRLNTHAYVNVDLKTTKGQSLNLSVRELQQQQKNNNAASTDRRLEFLSSGPGAFQLQSSSSPNRKYAIGSNSLHPTSGFNTNSSIPSCSAFSPTSSPMQHSFHAFCPINNNESSSYSLSPYRHQQLGLNRREMEDPCQRLIMSQSISGALPPSPSGIFPYNGSNNINNNNDSRQFSLYGKTSNSLEQITSKVQGRTVAPLSLQYSTNQQNGYRPMNSNQQLLQPNNDGGGGSSSCSILITSSTNTMGDS